MHLAKSSLPLLTAAAVVAATSSVLAATTQKYDFDAGAPGWSLDQVWSLAPSPTAPANTPATTGQALRGTGHGFARLTVQRDVSRLAFRARLDGWNTQLNVNVLETWTTGYTPQHLRYYLTIHSYRVQITYQDGSSFQSLGRGLAPIAPNRFHDFEVRLGAGSLDVAVDGEDLVGVDVPLKLPTGGVGFECDGTQPVYIDDVEVELGGQAVPHPQAPRPPLGVAAGPDVGKFVKGEFTGDLKLTNETLVLSKGRYTIRKGNIHLIGNSLLRIEPDAVLVFDRQDSPLVHWGIYLDRASPTQPAQTSTLEIMGNVLPVEGLVPIVAFGSSHVKVSGARPWVHFINAGGSAKIEVVNSRFVTAGGGIISISGSATVEVTNSRLGGVGLEVPAQSGFRAWNLPLFQVNFDSQVHLQTWKVPYHLKLKQVVLEPDTLGPGPYEWGWVLWVDESAFAEIRDSTLRKLILKLGSGPVPLVVSNLKLGTRTKVHLADMNIEGVTVNGQWGFFIPTNRTVTFDNCQGLWIWPSGTAAVLLRHSEMNEFDPRDYTATMTFEESRWDTCGEIVNDTSSGTAKASHFIMEGTYGVASEVRSSLSWENGNTVKRRFPVRVLDAAGQPVTGGQVHLHPPSGATADFVIGSGGWAAVEITFDAATYMLEDGWTLSADNGASAKVDFFTTTPVVLKGK